MSKTFRLYQYIDVEVEDIDEVLANRRNAFSERVQHRYVLEFIESLDWGNGMGCEFLGEDVEPYTIPFLPIADKLAVACLYPRLQFCSDDCQFDSGRERGTHHDFTE